MLIKHLETEDDGEVEEAKTDSQMPEIEIYVIQVLGTKFLLRYAQLDLCYRYIDLRMLILNHKNNRK